MAKKTTTPENPTFTVQQSVLNKALQTCGRALSDNKIIPVCEMFLFDLDGASLIISACNTQISISTDIPVTGKWPKICIPGRKLADYIAKSNNEDLTFELETGTRQLPSVTNHDGSIHTPEPETIYSIVIRSATGKLSLPAEPGDDFPKIPLDADTQSFSLSSEDFLTMLAKTIFAISEEQLRPVGTGLNMATSADSICVTSTNFHICATYSFPIALTEQVNIVIPKSTLQIIQSMSPTGSIQFDVCKRSIRFAFGNTIVTSLLIDATFPAYHGIIPTDNSINFSCSRLAMIKSLKRISSFTDVSKLIRLKITGLFATLIAHNPDLSEMATEDITAVCDVSDFEIGLNISYMLDILASLTSETVNMSFSTPRRAVIITDGYTHRAGDKENLVLIMPVFL